MCIRDRSVRPAGAASPAAMPSTVSAFAASARWASRLADAPRAAILSSRPTGAGSTAGLNSTVLQFPRSCSSVAVPPARPGRPCWKCCGA
eukprot:13379625-Alexandrium_andersonii.AAC.1